MSGLRNRLRAAPLVGAVVAALAVAGAAAAATIVGTARNDRLRGTAKADTLLGKGGNDRLFGLGGNDRLVGGPGNDVLDGGAGTDRLSCGPGRDVVLSGGGDRVSRDCEVVRGLPSVSVADAAATEGDSGPKTLSLPVTLSAPVSYTVTVAFATADGSASSTSDYGAASGTVTFLAGDTSKTIDVALNGDIDVEPDETFAVTLSAPVNATIADGSATATIRNDDRPRPRSGRYAGTTSQGNPISFEVSPDLQALSNLQAFVDIECPGVGQFNDLEIGTSGSVEIDSAWRFEITIPVSGEGVTGTFGLTGGLAPPGSASGSLRMDIVVDGDINCTTNVVTWSAS